MRIFATTNRINILGRADLPMHGKKLEWRNNYNMVSNNLVSDLKDASILLEVKHVDHCPAWVMLYKCANV